MKSLRAVVVVSLMSLAGPFALSAQEAVPAEQAAVQAPSEIPGAVPRLVKFSGVLQDALGAPRAGTLGVNFALYADPEGGAPLWLETQNVALDPEGRYTVLLGATRREGLPLKLFAANEARWLEIQIVGEPPQPRILLVSVPYALKAEEAERLGGKPASEFVLAEDLKSPEGQEKLGLKDKGPTTEGLNPVKNKYTATVATGPAFIWTGSSGPVLQTPTTALVANLNADLLDSLDSAALQRRVTGTCPAGQSIRIIATDGTVTCELDDTGAALGWALTGNAGTTAGTNFLGTTDNVALELKVNGLRALRLEPNATSPNVIGGFGSNSVTGGVVGATIGGGGDLSFPNRVTDNYGTVSGGQNNRAGDNAGTTSDRQFATVGGGSNNTASGFVATVGGGNGNTASGDLATVGGGQSNNASRTWATVGGGNGNTASGDLATVGGGGNNIASGQNATVPGGISNTASGSHSFAAGLGARALHSGAFVWGDSTSSLIDSTAANQFTARAAGGVRFFSNSALTAGVTLAPGASAWAAVSDRASKENFQEVDGKELLARLDAIPVLTWNWIAQGPAVRHMGPMAQDFSAAFGVGEDDKHISTVDADGVALAAVQALYRLVQEKDEQLRQLAEELKQLRAQVAALAAAKAD